MVSDLIPHIGCSKESTLMERKRMRKLVGHLRPSVAYIFESQKFFQFSIVQITACEIAAIVMFVHGNRQKAKIVQIKYID